MICLSLFFLISYLHPGLFNKINYSSTWFYRLLTYWVGERDGGQHSQHGWSSSVVPSLLAIGSLIQTKPRFIVCPPTRWQNPETCVLLASRLVTLNLFKPDIPDTSQPPISGSGVTFSTPRIAGLTSRPSHGLAFKHRAPADRWLSYTRVRSR